VRYPTYPAGVNGLDEPTNHLDMKTKDIIKDATLSAKGGAGLGFVDMARKSGEKLVFDFPEISEDYCFFCLSIDVSREPASTN